MDIYIITLEWRYNNDTGNNLLRLYIEALESDLIIKHIIEERYRGKRIIVMYFKAHILFGLNGTFRF